MIRVSVDDKLSDLTSEACNKVSDVLDKVASHIPPNRIVTHVSLDGVPVRRTGQGDLQIPLEQVGEMQIRTVDCEVWKATGLDICVSSIEHVQRSLIRAAELFRDADMGAGNPFFARCLEGMERFLESLLITRNVLKLDFTQIDIEGIKLAVFEAEFTQILESILDSQKKKDYSEVADKVEYELIPNLSIWSRALRQLRLSQRSNA